MKKGLFWCKNYNSDAPELITVSIACDANGQTDAQPDGFFSAKSGDNFNHRLEWARFGQEITEGHPFNYYPRGRVEIRNGKATIYLNPAINREDIIAKVVAAFALDAPAELKSIRAVNDGSEHYRFLCG